MKRLVPFHPILLAAFPTVAIYILNMDVVSPDELWRPLLVSIFVAIALLIVLSALFRSLTKGALAVTVVVALFFTFSKVAGLIDPSVTLWLDVLAAIAFIVWVWRTKRNLDVATRLLNFFSVVVLGLSLIQLFSHSGSRLDKPFLVAPVRTVATSASVKVKPDIFFVILDGYGRADQLKRVMGVDNTPFIGDLEKRGFYVAARSHSTYCQTQLSLASTLNLCHIQDYEKSFPAKSGNRANLTVGADQSYVAEYLRTLGYRYLAVTTGFDSVKFDSADLVYKEPTTYTMLESAIVAHTPIPNVATPITSLFEERRHMLRAGFSNLSRLTVPTSTPRFVIAHLMIPHPPFVFDRDGKPITQKPVFGYWDGSHYMSTIGGPDLYRAGYSGQVQYANKLLIAFVEEIERKNPNAVVILEGDHGSKLGLDQESLGKTDLNECFSNLIAIRSPESVSKRLYPTMTSVNTFRLVFNGLFGENIPAMPDNSYYSPFSKPYQFTEVTDRLQR